MHRRRLIAWCAALAAASPALASGPEQIEQLEPEVGVWQVEVSGGASRGSTAQPSLQILRGLSDHVAIGVEVESEWSSGRVKLDSFAPTILYRFHDASDGLGIGVVGQVELAPNFKPRSAEARVLVERKARRWWGQGNVIVRTVREDAQAATALAYSWRISRSLTRMLWLGAEGSGQAARLRGSVATMGARGQFVGPALIIAADRKSGAEIEVNASYLRRVAGRGSTGTVQLSAQISL